MLHVGFEPRTSRFGVRCSTTTSPRSLKDFNCAKSVIFYQCLTETYLPRKCLFFFLCCDNVFQYWRWEQTTPDPAITSGTRFSMTNRYLLDCSTEVYFFQATVAGNQIPDVTCHSTLKASKPPTTQQPTQPPQTTQNPETTQAPATTQQPPTTMEPGTTFLSYLVLSFIFESAGNSASTF